MVGGHITEASSENAASRNQNDATVRSGFQASKVLEGHMVDPSGLNHIRLDSGIT